MYVRMHSLRPTRIGRALRRREPTTRNYCIGKQIQPKGQRGMRFPCSLEPKEGGKSLQPVEVAVWRLRAFNTSHKLCSDCESHNAFQSVVGFPNVGLGPPIIPVPGNIYGSTNEKSLRNTASAVVRKQKSIENTATAPLSVRTPTAAAYFYGRYNLGT
jgi:hypothetical protein